MSNPTMPKSTDPKIHFQLEKILDNMDDSQMNIMLIDDDEASHIIHKIKLEDAGFNLKSVISCYGVDQAISKLSSLINLGCKDNWPNYIFLDINMPRKSGYDFISEFEKLNFTFDTPVIYLVSSSINPQDKQRAEKLELVRGFKPKFLDQKFIESLTSV